MDKYTLIDNTTGKKKTYTSVQWETAWAMVFVFGILTGLFLASIF